MSCFFFGQISVGRDSPWVSQLHFSTVFLKYFIRVQTLALSVCGQRHSELYRCPQTSEETCGRYFDNFLSLSGFFSLPEREFAFGQILVGCGGLSSWVFAVSVSISSGIPCRWKQTPVKTKAGSRGTVSIVSQVPSYKTVMGREGGRRCCQLNPSNPSYLWLCFVDFFVYSPPPLPRNSLLVNCEILRKNLIPILPGLLWELIRKFSSGAGIYSQIASTS